MLKRYTFWTKAAIVLQFLTAGVHSISFFVEPDLKTDTERQLHELITTYHPDMGAGFHPSFLNLFTALSACFSLLCVLGGLTLVYLLWKKASPSLMKGILGINALVFGVTFVVMLVLTFILPITMIGLIFVTSMVAYILAPRIEPTV